MEVERHVTRIFLSDDNNLCVEIDPYGKVLIQYDENILWADTEGVAHLRSLKFGNDNYAALVAYVKSLGGEAVAVLSCGNIKLYKKYVLVGSQINFNRQAVRH